MVKRKKSKTILQRELTKLKKEKEEVAAKRKEIEEIREIKRDIAKLKGAGTKRRVAAQVAKKIGTDVSKVGWKGLKMAGKFVKNVIEAEAREQARDRARASPRPKPIKRRKKKR